MIGQSLIKQANQAIIDGKKGLVQFRKQRLSPSRVRGCILLKYWIIAVIMN